MAEPRRQRVADDRRDARRSHVGARPRGALRRRHAEALVDQQHDADLRRIRRGARRLVPVGASRWASARRSTGSPTRASSRTSWVSRDVHSAIRPSRARRRSPWRRPGRLQVPAVLAGLLPVRVRRDHADPDARLGARTDQLQGLDPVRRCCGSRPSTWSTPSHLGRRLVRPARRRRLLGWVRDPPVGRCLGLRGGGGDRTAAPARPRDRRAEQRADGGRRSRSAVARLERLQRRRPVLRRSLGVGARW